jgi:hypothetical protein
VPVLVARDDAENALLGQHFGAVGAGNRLALIGRHIGDQLRRRRAAAAQRADNQRNTPDAVLVGDQHVVAAQGHAVRLVEIIGKTINPFGRPTLAIVAQQGQIAGTLLGQQHVAVGEHQQPAWMGENRRRRGSR